MHLTKSKQASQTLQLARCSIKSVRMLDQKTITHVMLGVSQASLSLESETGLPTYFVVDYNPGGFKVFLTYISGSVRYSV